MQSESSLACDELPVFLDHNNHPSFWVLSAVLQVPENRSGCVVYKIDPLSEASKVLEVMDVVMEVDGIPIADDGTVQFREDERVEFSHIVRSKHIDDTLHLKILRNGQVWL